MASIKDVAKLAEVNQAIVSRVINHDPTLRIREETRSRVEAAIRQLNYRPDILGRSLRSKTTRTIGVLIPSVINPYYAELVTGIDRAAAENDFRLIQFNMQREGQNELELVQAALDFHVDGFLIVAKDKNIRFLQILEESKKPYVSVHQKIDAPSSVFVGTDDRKGVFLAIEHLIKLGHRHIAHIAGSTESYTSLLRRESFKQAAEFYNLEVGEHDIVSCENRIDLAYHAMKRLLHASVSPPTAVLCFNDVAAVGALNAILEEGLRVPDDISLVGYDDVWLAAQLHPHLTTIRIFSEEIGHRAAMLLLQMMRGESLEQRDYVLDVELLVRHSTGPCKRLN